MLVLTRKQGESFVLIVDGAVIGQIHMSRISEGKASIAIDAPRVRVIRKELFGCPKTR